MPVFGYRVTDASGRVTEGVIERSGSGATDRLREMNLVRFASGPRRSVRSGGGRVLRGGTRAARKDLLPFLQGVRTLLAAGIPMDRALEMTAEFFRGGPMGAVSVSLLREVRGGRSSPTRCATPPADRSAASWSRWSRRAGHRAAGGSPRTGVPVPGAFRDFRANLLGSLLYPAILLFASVVSVVLLVAFVVPASPECSPPRASFSPFPPASCSA